ncbi:MAG TPA: sigma-70 family RNA polymerase sigma factor [Polyangiaceae bacterium]|nr:sigma-70 family RNA polymerase sigma factor [Polyangiaceae bacterium]
MTLDSLSTDPAEPLLQSGAVAGLGRERVRKLIDEHYAFIWRLLARLGVRTADVDDATQQVFMVLLTRERLTIQTGSERAFLFGTALRVAREHRRRDKKHAAQTDVDFDTLQHPGIDLESLTDQQRARALLDRLVQSIPEELRLVFILFEIEGLPAIEVAGLLDMPAGTVASRLRRARQHFREAARQMNIPGTLKGLR